jgi:hypothetical protein
MAIRWLPRFSIAVAVLLFTQLPCQAQKSKALSTIMKLVTAGTAAYSADKAIHSDETFDKARRDASNSATDVARAKAKEVQFESQILTKLRAQGVDASEQAIYSVYFTLNNDASSVYWADIFSKPDVFFYFDLEGHGTYVDPQIRYEYAGGPVLYRIIAREVRSGSKIVIRFMDDDTSSDEVWKSLLQTRVNFDVTGGLTATILATAQTSISGHLQVLSSGTQVMLDPPDEIVAATTTVPATEDGTWLASGDLSDSDNRIVGSIQIACVWSARGERAAFDAKVAAERAKLARERSAVEAKESEHNEKAAQAAGSFWFWAVAGSLALLWFVFHLVRKDAG